LGGSGVISVLSNVAPKYTHDICQTYFDGDVKTSAKMQLDAIPLIKALFSEVNPIPAKAAMSMMGYCADVLRRPLTPMEDAHAAVLRTEMQKFGILE
jgi:4-hydroxy-tetrahydrodipicolinate synthase